MADVLAGVLPDDREFRRMRDIPIEQPLSLADREEVDRMGEKGWVAAVPHHRIAYAMNRFSP